MTRRGLLAAFAILGGLAGPAVAEPRDIPWFEARPAERAATMRRCERDVALAQSRVCQNARRASAVDLMTPIPPSAPDPWLRRSAPPEPKAQMPVPPRPAVAPRRAT